MALLRWYEAQVYLTVAFSSSAFFGLLFLIFILTILIDSLCSGLVSLLASQAHNTMLFNQPLVLLAVWAGAVFCWKMKSASLKAGQQKEA